MGFLARWQRRDAAALVAASKDHTNTVDTAGAASSAMFHARRSLTTFGIAPQVRGDPDRNWYCLAAGAGWGCSRTGFAAGQAAHAALVAARVGPGRLRRRVSG